MKRLIAILFLGLCCVVNAQTTWEKAQPLTLRTCEGDVIISDNYLMFRGYTFVADRILGDTRISLKTQDGMTTALLDMQADETILLTIREGAVSMQIKSCVRELLCGDEPVVASFPRSEQRYHKARILLRQGLLAANM